MAAEPRAALTRALPFAELAPSSGDAERMRGVSVPWRTLGAVIVDLLGGPAVSSACHDGVHSECRNGPFAEWSWCECACHAERA